MRLILFTYFFSCGLYTMAINVFTWRITTKRVHLFSSLAQFSLIASFCVFLQKISGASHIFLNSKYIYKIEIRNSKIYLPEVSVSSTMVERQVLNGTMFYECFMMFYLWFTLFYVWFTMFFVFYDVSQCFVEQCWSHNDQHQCLKLNPLWNLSSRNRVTPVSIQDGV